MVASCTRSTGPSWRSSAGSWPRTDGRSLARAEGYAPKGYVFALVRSGEPGDAQVLRDYLERYLPHHGLRTDQSYVMGGLLYLDDRLGTDFASDLLTPGGLWERWATAPGWPPEDRWRTKAEVTAWCDFAATYDR
ncbi:DUF6000 family protein [Micromonospora sp. DT31]|uniref:DUF6000 family protein n=1 Tax=Micromonospora sp. DT31 TaxID=3393434 RepID=UPI003CEB77E0